ncbi:DNA polymerase III subunit delta' [Nocardioides sp. W7]|uniref:DNA polymerase III subunit delta' n=1 Tax=Nocardioides sp. W7 TaxID=2931390 RepID=UPI001FD5CFA5|nr:DNA polymerase III subunit delta' [Nocardioides sp. W7]
MSVWDDLVGQHRAAEALREAAAGHGMSHAWLFTGPPGSGRSNAAVAFAAALQCERGRDSGPADGGRASVPGVETSGSAEVGCGVCHACHTVLAGSHADVKRVSTEGLSLGVDFIRDLVRASALTPVGRGWQVIIVEDADRLTERAVNALLKAIEEPAVRTVWMLCTPTVEDVLPTIRSRCRLVTLTTPSAADVAAFLVRADGVSDALASYAARASQGHIGRARALARDEGTRNRRREVVSIPVGLTSLGRSMKAAQRLAEVTKEEADLVTGELDAREKVDLDSAYGVVERGRRPREYAPALAHLLKEQKSRAKRRHLDVVDRSLMDLVSVYRDAVALATGAPGELVNAEIRADVEKIAAGSTPELNLRRIGWIFEAREQMLEFNVQPALALESMMVALQAPDGASA